jgi:hypothetical protein
VANVRYWFGSWVSTNGDELPPGGVHSWVAWSYNYGETITITANPLIDESGGEQQILTVENVQVEADVSGRRMFFNVRNVGPGSIDGYGIAYSFVSS